MIFNLYNIILSLNRIFVYHDCIFLEKTFSSYLDAPRLRHDRGDVDGDYEKSPHKLESTMRMGGQEHFYFETNATLAKPVDNCREMEIFASCQNVAHAQHREIYKIRVLFLFSNCLFFSIYK